MSKATLFEDVNRVEDIEIGRLNNYEPTETFIKDIEDSILEYTKNVLKLEY